MSNTNPPVIGRRPPPSWMVATPLTDPEPIAPAMPVPIVEVPAAAAVPDASASVQVPVKRHRSTALFG